MTNILAVLKRTLSGITESIQCHLSSLLAAKEGLIRPRVVPVAVASTENSYFVKIGMHRSDGSRTIVSNMTLACRLMLASLSMMESLSREAVTEIFMTGSIRSPVPLKAGTCPKSIPLPG